MINAKFVIILSIFLGLTQSLFSKDSAVVELTKSNFDSSVLKSDEIWLVEFYAPWCGHCKRSAPEFQKAAEILKGIVNVGAVDMTVHGEVGHPYDVQGYPTIKLFGRDKKKPYDFSSGDRTFQKFVNFSLGKAKAQITARLDDISKRETEDKTETEL